MEYKGKTISGLIDSEKELELIDKAQDLLIEMLTDQNVDSFKFAPYAKKLFYAGYHSSEIECYVLAIIATVSFQSVMKMQNEDKGGEKK